MFKGNDTEQTGSSRLSSATLHDLVRLSLKDMRSTTVALEAAFKNGEPTERLFNRLYQTSTVLNAAMKESLERVS